MDLILITSVINIVGDPLSYIKTRSVYNKQQRFEQTLITIESLSKINAKKILFIEASNIPEYELELISKVDIYKNIYKNDHIKKIIDGPHKSIGESLSVLEGINGVDLSLYDNIYKISGRYYLTDKFDYHLWNNEHTIFYNDLKQDILLTSFYKINCKQYDEWIYLLENIYKNKNKESIEIIFRKQFKNYKSIESLGVAGYISVNGVYWEN